VRHRREGGRKVREGRRGGREETGGRAERIEGKRVEEREWGRGRERGEL